MKYLGYVLLIIATVSSLSCGKKSSAYSDGVVVLSYRLIDSNRTDEAIELLEQNLALQPANIEYRIILASAYAHKGGFRIQRFVPVLSQRQNFSQIRNSFRRNNSDSGESESMANSIANILMGASGLFRIYSVIPVIEPDRIFYIRHAIEILKAVPHIESEHALYKAILEVLLFKHLFSEKLAAEFTQPANRTESSCRIDLMVVNDVTLEMGRLLIEIFSDLSISKPSSQESFQELSNDVAAAVSDISLATAGISAIDEVSQLFLKQLAIQNGLGKLIRCN